MKLNLLRQKAFTLAAVILIAVSAARQLARADNAEPFDVPLTVIEAANVDRVSDPVSIGVPFPAGLLTATDDIAVFDPTGKPIPAQFRELERWREFGVDRTIKWLLVTFLVDVHAGERPVYHIRRGNNPAPAANARPVESLKPFQLVLTDPEGRTIDDSELEITREVVESGPVRACVKFEAPSSHRSFGFIAWIYTYAGLSRTDASVVLKNTPNDPQGPFYFKNFSVVASFADRADADSFLLGGEPGHAIAGKLAADDAAFLYQDSDGTDHWQKLGIGTSWASAFVLDNSKERTLASKGIPQFRGYRVNAHGKQLDSGNQALGWCARRRSAFDNAGRPALLLQLPGGCGGSIGEVDRAFVAQILERPRRPALARRLAAQTPRSHVAGSKRQIGGTRDEIALAFDMPLVAHAGYEWYQRTGAAGYLDPGSAKPSGEFKFEPGWVTFGGDPDRIRRRYHEQTMHPFLEVADPWRAYYLAVAAGHSAGMTPVYLDDYQYPRDANAISVKQYCTAARPAGKYLPDTGHHGFKPWNMAHFTCQELFDDYRLFGDPLALEAIRDVATYQQFYVDHRKRGGGLVAGTRSDGLPLKNLAEAYRITGDERIFESLRSLAIVSWKQVDKKRGNYGVMKIWESGKESVEKPFMMSQVMDGLKEYYDLTHDERAADQMLGMTNFILRESFCGPDGVHVCRQARRRRSAAEVSRGKRAQ